MTLLGSSVIQTGKEAGLGALESCHHLPSMNHGVPFPLCCFLGFTRCFLRPATHMDTWTRYTESIMLATPGINQACHIYTSVSTNSAVFWGDNRTLLCCKQRFVAAKWTYCGFTRQIKALNFYLQVVLQNSLFTDIPISQQIYIFSIFLKQVLIKASATMLGP